MSDTAPIEYAAATDRTNNAAYDDIVQKTGLRAETVAQLGMSNNLTVLFGDDNQLRSSTELRSMEAAGALSVSPVRERRRSVHEKLLDLMAMKWPDTRTPADRLTQLRDMRLDWEQDPEKRRLADRFRELEAMRPDS